eukprot:CAMPEP_0172836404 /NCGR_PEP_ID=MMETSP1075-20121228/26465_1 /TAXON_ID=2916 /ORGANISM="Ceratium fusus, Strain PA161109" /LENGTH=55 /DNA_ID=CAMNT_0013679627 /DNA_START=26 /DNA_END=193 /DNA_ORIENTATION=-
MGRPPRTATLYIQWHVALICMGDACLRVGSKHGLKDNQAQGTPLTSNIVRRLVTN